MTNAEKAYVKQNNVRFWFGQAEDTALNFPQFQNLLPAYRAALEETEYGDGICPLCFFTSKQTRRPRPATELNADNDRNVDYFMCSACESEFKRSD